MHCRRWRKSARKRRNNPVPILGRSPTRTTLQNTLNLHQEVGFGMPPATEDQGETTCASGAGKPAIGMAIATHAEDQMRREDQEDTAADDLKDKYNYYDILQHEFETPEPVAVPNVLGRLRARVAQWEKMGASDYILDTIRSGYKIPFIDTPEPKYFKNNKSALRNKDFVGQALDELLKSGRIIKLDNPPKVTNPLSVAENGEKKRLILDLRYVNQHLWKAHIKFEDFKHFKNFIKKGSYMFHFDFRSGYHHIDIFQEHWTYLGFSWTSEDGVTSYYCFVVLPFGLSTAPYIFTKVCRVFVKYWRSHGIKIVIFIDDGIGAASSYGKCKIVSEFVKMSIEDSGFLSNEEKSNWDPIQNAVWLGLEIDTKLFVLKIKEKRVTKIMSKIAEMQPREVASARQISSIAGGVISQTIVLGPVTGLFTREMYHFIDSCHTWDKKVSIPTGVYNELTFWQENLPSLNLKHLDEPLVPVCASTAVNSDASSQGCGAIMKIDDTIFQAHKSFSTEEASRSSTWRELEAVVYAVRSFTPMLKGRVVNWETDNQAVPVIVTKGSKKEHLQQLAVQLYFICKHNDINLHLNWIPRDENVVADELSKYVDYDDWKTSDAFFNYLNQKWGPFTIDRFANHKNAKIVRHNALFWNPHCEAVDAFTQDWSHECNWVVPPVYLVADALRHAKACKASGTLIAPYWESAPFWPMLRENNRVFKRFVLTYQLFDDTRGILELGDFKKSLLGSSKFKSPIIAIRFQFQ